MKSAREIYPKLKDYKFWKVCGAIYGHPKGTGLEYMLTPDTFVYFDDIGIIGLTDSTQLSEMVAKEHFALPNYEFWYRKYVDWLEENVKI